MSETRLQPAARKWRPLPILEFWGRVTIALDQEPYKQRHFPGGCRVSCWDLGERQSVVVEGHGTFARYVNLAPSA